MRWLKTCYTILLRPRTKISKREAGILKDQIRHRLKTGDYRCRLPSGKPKVRYKLRFRRHGYLWVYK